MGNKYLYNVVIIQIQRVISSRAFKNNGTWTSVEGVWLCERRQNHLSPEVGGGDAESQHYCSFKEQEI